MYVLNLPPLRAWFDRMGVLRQLSGESKFAFAVYGTDYRSWLSKRLRGPLPALVMMPTRPTFSENSKIHQDMDAQDEL